MICTQKKNRDVYVKQLKSDGIVWRFNDEKCVRATAFENRQQKSDLSHSKIKTTNSSDFYLAKQLTEIEYESLIHHYLVLFCQHRCVQGPNYQMEK